MHVAQELLPWMESTPQPVALATGRVVRAIGSAEKLDACIKAAEVIARFVAVASLASSAASRPENEPPPEVDNFVGNLAFGVFENAARATAAVTWNHPLREQLRLCLKSAKKRKAVAGQRLEQFVELRNELGHAITPADEARARALLERDDPVGGLIELLEGLQAILACPLLVLLGQEHRRGRFVGRFAFFAGEGEPIPQELELRDPIYEWETPYLCTPQGLIPLAPGLLYQPRASDGRYGLYLLDAIAEDSLRYKGVQESGSISRSEGLREMNAWLRLPFDVPGTASSHPLLEPITCVDGRSLHGHLSGQELEPAVSGEGGPESDGEVVAPSPGGAPVVANLRRFEQGLNGLGLGTAYRDILYCLAGHGARAELSADGVRIVTATEPSCVLATVKVSPTGSLVVTVFTGALASGSAEQPESHELRPGDPADQIVGRIEDLFEVNLAPPDPPADR